MKVIPPRKNGFCFPNNDLARAQGLPSAQTAVRRMHLERLCYSERQDDQMVLFVALTWIFRQDAWLGLPS